MLEKKIIYESNSPFSNRILLIQEKDGRVRFRFDYRQLNSSTVKDSYHIPDIDDLIDASGESDWFRGPDCCTVY